MEQVLGALAVFWVWTVAQRWVSAPEWGWWLWITLTSIGWQLLIEPSNWWWGLGIAGLSFLIRRIDDLLLLVGDRAKFDILRTTRR